MTKPAGSGMRLTQATSLLNVSGASDISFSGVSFDGVRGSAITLRDSSDVVVRDGAIRFAGLNAFNVSGGERCGIDNMTVSAGGQGCVVLDGGDRTTLTSSNHFVNDSHVSECQRWTKNYAPHVTMAGVGQSVSRSELVDSPQQIIFVMGNDHVLQDSTVINATMQCSGIHLTIPDHVCEFLR